MFRMNKTSLALMLSLLGVASFVHADDTEIYFSGAKTAADEPLVMFSVDVKANVLGATVCNGSECDALYAAGHLRKDPATTKIQALDLYSAVLRKVLKSLAAGGGKFKVGLMVNHDNGSGASCSGPTGAKCTNGGFIARRFRSTDPAKDPTSVDDLGDKLDGLLAAATGGGSVQHVYQGAEQFFELFRYLTGQEVYNGHNGWADFGTNQTANLDTEMAAAGPRKWITWDTAAQSGKDYVSPLAGLGECARIFTINIVSGNMLQDDDSDKAITDTKGKGGMAGIALTGKGSRTEAVLSWLKDADLADGTWGKAPNVAGKQNVQSYFLVPATGGGVASADHKLAIAGGTGQALPLSSNPAEMEALFNAIFGEILSVSTTFVAASVPVSSFNRAEVIDNVYLGLFQPTQPAIWPGNVKKLKLGKNAAGTSVLKDANDVDAVANDGRIKFDALSFWTVPASLPTPPDPNVTGDESSMVVAGKDGRFVPRGGAGQKIVGVAGSGSTNPGVANGAGARRLFTGPTSGSVLVDLNANDTTAAALQTALGAASVGEARCLLRYARGYPINAGDLTACPTANPTTARGWIMGAVLHSSPTPINYGGSKTNPDIRIVAGSNDGYMRMFRNTTAGGAESGAEVWAFMPREVMPILKQAVLAGAKGAHVYGVDGEPTVYLKDTNGNGTIDTGEKVWLFFGLRRGGSGYYALDISDPDNPKFMWRILRGGSFGELGLSFSTATTGMLDWGSGAKPVLVFGGGYDVNKDARGAVGTNDTQGRAIYVVDAETGALVWKAVGAGTASASTFVHAGMLDSIPSRVVAYDSGTDGLIDRFYVGDTGGKVWRGDLPGTDRSKWSVTTVLSVGRHAGQPDRRFHHAPDVALSNDDAGNFDAVVIGSGDRPNPLGASVPNEMYMFKDRNTTSGAPPTVTRGRSDLADLTDNCLQDLDKTCSPIPDLTHGWRMSFKATGEKSLSSPVTFAGVVFFTSYVPPAGGGAVQCGAAEGGGRLYAVSLQEAKAIINWDTTNDGDGGGELQEEDRFRDLKSGGIPTTPVLLPSPPGIEVMGADNQFDDPKLESGFKTFWFQSLD